MLGKLKLIARTSIAFPEQGPRLSDGIAFAKLMTAPTMNQVRRFPVFKVVEEVAHRRKMAFGDGAIVSESVEGYLLMLGEMNFI